MKFLFCSIFTQLWLYHLEMDNGVLGEIGMNALHLVEEVTEFVGEDVTTHLPRMEARIVRDATLIMNSAILMLVLNPSVCHHGHPGFLQMLPVQPMAMEKGDSDFRAGLLLLILDSSRWLRPKRKSGSVTVMVVVRGQVRSMLSSSCNKYKSQWLQTWRTVC